jgi:SH3-like domain-containing protein
MTVRRRVRIVMAVIAAVVLATIASAGASSFVRVKTDTLNVRERPTTKSDLLWQVYKNEPLEVLERDRRWLRVRDFEGYEGWVYAPLTDGEPTVIVTAPVANVRSGPGTDHAVTYTAPRGVAFLLLRTQKQWLEVQHDDGARGWIHESLLWGGPVSN